MKKCNHCKIEKSFLEFSKNKNELDNLNRTCKECAKKFSKNYNDKIKIIPKFKFCTNCNIEKDEKEFHRKKSSKDGLYNICKKCRLPLSKEYNKKNSERNSVSCKKWKLKNPDYFNKNKLDPILKYEQRLKNCNEVHNHKYKYDKTDFTILNINLEKSTIICPIHGDFLQKLFSHINRAYGCPKCANEKSSVNNSKNPTGWGKSNWKKQGEQSRNFHSFKIYIIKCWNENEEFYKIGRTFKEVKNRFRCKVSMPYNYKVIYTIESNAEKIFDIENMLKKDHEIYKYKPSIYFKGINECFKKIDNTFINNYITAETRHFETKIT